ncbi:2'-5' RNA ligase family protein [Comamonas kerstersii]|uniref:2'-5' RNA ligase family protein n=1 Tax=Comamonas kerstersii TaxID=225992 RepID=A0A1V3TLZ7_9BURK|nr:2'-5' RNA ligase family protein [Comamonas kerstersii]AQZ98100.1 hypothetical protein B5M06_07360 [Comamonas kerstersii]OOH86973.1 hypothetical protein BMF38_08065 [Comamonas kerstersii]OOH90011.1 hypothetical protein BMF29_13670 [Comamonas kerstersii]
MPTIAHTEVCEDRDFAEWHQGRPWCGVWVVRAEAPRVQALVQVARSALRPWLLPRYARQPHITLAYRGLMPRDAADTQAEFGLPQLLADVQALQAAQLPPFAWQLQGVGSFSTVPYLALSHSPALHIAHEALMARTPYPGWHYVPHITLGHYGRRLPLAEALQALQSSVPDGPLHAAQADALWLARYRSSDIAGPLYFEGRFDLATQQYVAEPEALLQP